MQNRKLSIILTIVGLAGFITFTFFPGGSNASSIEACKVAVTEKYKDGSDTEMLLEQCETDQGFVILMTNEFSDAQSLSTSFSESNKKEILFNALRWAFAGLGIVGILAFFKKRL